MTGKHKKRGFSLIEAAIVLAVVGLVLGGIWWGATSVQKNIKIKSVAEDIILFCNTSMRIMPRSVIPSNTDYFTASQIFSMGLLPKTWMKGNTTVAPFGVELKKSGNLIPSQAGYVGQTSAMGAPFQGTTFIAIGAKKESCIKLVSYLAKRTVALQKGSRPILMVMVQKWSDADFTTLLSRNDYLSTTGWMGHDDFSGLDSACGEVTSLNFYCNPGY